ncbi:MAG: EAL domain-containing protein [Thermoanaerobaculia bacterium]|jgi:diguanylate cyclase (GGDEF)-like protein/PAS domain S-box-containing protein
MTSELDREMRTTTRLQTAAIESAANAIFITNKTGVIVWANPAFEVLTGHPVEDVLGLNPRILKSGEQDEDFYRDLWRTLLKGEVWHGRVTNRHRSGGLYTAEQTITPILDDDGVVTHFVAIHEDITARLASEERIAHMALHDFLTDLPNRYALDSRLDIELIRARRLGTRVAILLIDLDNFKEVNDTLGHAAGDQLLIAVGERLEETLRDVDMISRLGGDEFAVLQPDIAGRKNAANLAERLLRAFSDSFDVGSQEVSVETSIGISVSNGETTSKSEFIREADLALYRAKSEGRNTFRFFKDEMNIEIQRRMSLARDMHGAVQRNELFLEYQPQVSLGERRIVGIEALLRWRHPELGILEPTEFVPIAESVGLIVEVGEWVLQAACRQAKNWQNRKLPALPVAVNISAAELRDSRFVSRVSRILAETGLEPQYLELELTERVLMEGKDAVERTLETLSELGVRISLDHFGTGYASLDYLRSHPLSKVKIDQSFVQDMETNIKNATIVGAIIDLAAKLDLQVTAEGVEAADLVQCLIDEGCDEVQGFYFSRPVSAERLEQLLTLGSVHIQAHPKQERRKRA